MNLWQTARRRRFDVPAGVNPYAGLIGASGLGVGSVLGKYETAPFPLEEITERVYKRSGPIWSLVAIRMQLFAEARLAWQTLSNGRPGKIFGDQSLELLETPWPGGTTADLLSRMLLHADLMGNAFVTNRLGDRLRVLRPDWTTIIWGSNTDAEAEGDALDGELVAYYYRPRMPGAFGWNDGAGTTLYPDEVAHFAPNPDPAYMQRGMSWLTPVLREIQGDDSALEHKLAFFRNGAVPRLAMKVDPSVSKENFERLVAAMEQQHAGAINHYRTLYVGGGADPVPLTFNLRDLDFAKIQGAGETRLAAAAGIPPVIAGFSEGLAGSSLNAGNFQQARRRLGDVTIRPLWRKACGALATIVPPPNSARLWVDDRDIPFLREDRTDAASIGAQTATTIRTLLDAGFHPDAAVAAAMSGDFAQLSGQHSGLFSVQLQPPGAGAPTTDTDIADERQAS